MGHEDASKASPRKTTRASIPAIEPASYAAASGASHPLGFVRSPPSATSPRINRKVQTRSEFRITFAIDDSNSAGNAEDRWGATGWSSPHALPYRPLGKPDLNMKLSPNLRSTSVRNESTSNPATPRKTTELRSPNEAASTEARGGGLGIPGGAGDDGSSVHTPPQLPMYSPSHVQHLECPTRVIQTDPSFAMLQQAIRDCSARVCSVKYGASAFSKAIVPESVADIARSDASSSFPQRPYLPYTTRKPQASPIPPLPTFQKFQADAEAAAAAAAAASSSAKPGMSSRSLVPPSSSSSSSSSPLKNHTLAPLGTIDVVQPEPKAAQCVDKLSKSLDGIVSLGASSSLNANSSALPALSTNEKADDHVHGIERLQLVIDAREEMKRVVSSELLAILASLDQGRWTCFCLKYAHFKPHRDLYASLFALNDVSETARRAKIEQATERAASWFSALLAIVSRYTPSGQDPPSGCAFFIDTIRRIVADGYELQPAILCSMVLCLTKDELQLDSTQAMLKYLRHVAGISLERWEQFFTASNLDMPFEVVESHAAAQIAARKRSKMQFAKIKQVIRTKGMMDAIMKPRLDVIHRRQSKR
ncbi:hypothetical protein LEN26_008554 [Aphanomyces euteiches]|nr:hypothetical protein LEN26_008554 [Aphanomyces euteiches]